VKGLLSTGSISPRAAQSLAVASTDSGLLIASPQVRRELNAPSVQAGQQMFSPSDLSTEDTMFEELPQEARSIVEQRMAKWEGERGMSRRRQSPRAEARRGAPVREELARTNMMMRFLQLWYVFKTMLNPGLHVAAYLELAQKSTQERVVSFLDGSNPASILSGQGFTAEQRRLWKDTRAALAKNPQFYGMIFANTNWNPHEGAGGKVEAKLQRIVNYTSAMFNDPTWMQRGDAMAQAFMEAAWDSLQKTDTHITPEQFLDTLGANPEALTQISKDAVDM